ncbi:VWA domain-containing protein [Halosquirtibacter laminarini]|uniref:VWA domain-containing protein n=1 Tax=Halosquirtibacter laminarini TaxID=3374600 RepID=A0AC61NQS8_9BACT|nr:VWA domain-containing protein [Prolixibacteraceae bacterium]
MNNTDLIKYLDQFHFLRPVLLWFFIPLFLSLVYYVIIRNRDAKWQKLLRPEYRLFLITNTKSKKITWPSIIFFTIFTLAILGIAGPTFKKKKLPKVTNKSEVMIALDLSQSMMTTDVPPNRLERSKLKIRDLFKQELGTKIGLLAFAGTAHTIFPPSQDSEIMVPYMTTIKPRIMPVAGLNYSFMIERIDTLFKTIEAPSTLLLLTDEINPSQAAILQNFVNTTKNYIVVWQVSTQQGGVVPSPQNIKRGLRYKGKTIESRPDASVFSSLQSNERIWVVPITLDDTDTQYIANIIQQHRVIQSDSKNQSDDWKDVGPWFLIPCLLLGLLWFRKGWVIGWCFLLLPWLTSCDTNGPSAKWWYTDDYRAYKAFEAKDYEKASQLYSDVSHKAYAYYKKGDLDNAAIYYAMDTTAQAKYNLGMIYAQKGEYLLAQKSIQLAIEKDPNLKQADKQLDIIQKIIDTKPKLLKEQKEDQKRSVQQFKKIEELSEKEKKLSDNDYNAKRDTTDNSHDKVYGDKHKYKEVDWPQEKKKKDQIKNQVQASSLIMEKTNSDPSEFLRKKFILQKKKYYPQVKTGGEIW